MGNSVDDQRTRDLVLSDLRAEGDDLDVIVSASEVDFDHATPAVGWSIGHQIGHLLWTDRMSLLACKDPGGFSRQADAFGADPETINRGAATEAQRPADQLIAEWRYARADLLSRLGHLTIGTRIPWFGPPVDVPSMASSRIMEIWAHRLDITDALGLAPAASSRLRHVAELGVRTRDFAFSLHRSRSPGSPFRVELTAPDGELWTWGKPGAAGQITGSALDFCLLITQRRHRDDLDLVASPGAADRWLDIAQVFAGPAGAGRSPRVRA